MTLSHYIPTPGHYTRDTKGAARVSGLLAGASPQGVSAQRGCVDRPWRGSRWLSWSAAGWSRRAHRRWGHSSQESRHDCLGAGPSLRHRLRYFDRSMIDELLTAVKHFPRYYGGSVGDAAWWLLTGKRVPLAGRTTCTYPPIRQLGQSVNFEVDASTTPERLAEIYRPTHRWMNARPMPDQSAMAGMRFELRKRMPCDARTYEDGFHRGSVRITTDPACMFIPTPPASDLADRRARREWIAT